MKRRIEIYDVLCFLLGFTCILEVFRLKVGAVFINISDIIFFLLFAHFIIFPTNGITDICDAQVKIIKKYFFLVLLFGLNVFSPFIDSVFYPEVSIDGVTPALKYAIKTFINILFFLLVFKQNDIKKLTLLKQFVYGFTFALVVHILYSTIQMLYWYVLGIDIHTPFLYSFGLNEDVIGHPFTNFVIWPVLRATGLYWDAYYMGIVGSIALFTSFYIQRPLIKHLSILFILINLFLSFSRTGYIAVIGTMIIINYYRNLNITLDGLYNFGKIIRSAVLIAIIGSFVLSFVLTDDIKEMVSESFTYKSEVKKNDEGDMRHVMYPVYGVEAICMDPIHFCIGYGPRNSSRAIFMTGHIPDFTNQKESFDIESDWCKQLINGGFFCFIFYLLLNYYLIKNIIIYGNFSDNYISMFFLSSLLCIFISGFFYCLNDSRWVWLVYCMSIIYINNGCQLDTSDN